MYFIGIISKMLKLSMLLKSLSVKRTQDFTFLNFPSVCSWEGNNFRLSVRLSLSKTISFVAFNCVSQRARTHWANFCLFCEKICHQFPETSASSTKFCQGLPNFKDAVVLPRSRINFCQAWNLTDLSIYTPWFEGKCQSRKFDLYF